MSTDLTHVRAIVSGGGSGMGRAMVEAMLAHGASVVAADVDQAGLCALGRLDDAGRLSTVRADLAEAGAARLVLAAADHAFGGANVIISNAGIGRAAYAEDIFNRPPPVWEVPDDTWRRFFAVNTLGAIGLINAAMPTLLSTGWGRVILVTTSLDSMIDLGAGPYGPSKAALEAYAAILSNEVRRSDVTVNVLTPGGPVDTTMIPTAVVADRASLLPVDVLVPPLMWLLTKAADRQNGRRLRANLWPKDTDPLAALAMASAPIAWAILAQGQRRSPGNHERDAL
jgi:NAD(P)-dependent dehydrogenase (short-subunit alcohol dehydrogenase family)